jgi:hypothetical protein
MPTLGLTWRMPVEDDAYRAAVGATVAERIHATKA